MRSLVQLVVAAFAATVLMACARSPVVTAAPSAPVATVPDSVRIVEPAITALSPLKAQFDLIVRTNSSETIPGGRSDSTNRQNEFEAALEPSSGNTFTLVLRAPRVAPDSGALPRERRNPADSIESISLTVDALAHHVTVKERGPQAPCSGAVTLLSPLIGRLLTIPPSLFSAASRKLTDSLSYSSCSGPALLNTIVRLQYERTNNREISVQIIGDVRADSTKALPMRLTGTFTGNATITLAPDRSSFADYFLASIDLSLNAESSLRRQNLRQRSELSVRRH